MELAVVHGAPMMCSCGSKPDQLRVVSQNTVAIGHELGATVMDYAPGVNVGPFGQCAKGGPCAPVFPVPWMPGSPFGVKLEGKPILRDVDILGCAKGGVVKFMSAMQANTYVDR
jgi:hypothetical protein